MTKRLHHSRTSCRERPLLPDDRRPRVLYCTDTYPPQVNGVSVVTALSVAGLQARGWDVGVVRPRYDRDLEDVFEPGSRSRDVGCRVSLPNVSLPPYPDIRLAFPMYGRVARAVRRFKPDLVHCATEFVIGRMGQIAAARAGIPSVSSYHTDFGRYAAAYGAPWLRGTVSSYLRRFHRRSRRVYTPSAPAREELRFLGLRDVEVWGRGVDCEQFHPRRRSTLLRESLGAADALLMLHVGRLAAEKNVHVIIDAFRSVRQRLARPAKLVIAGTGPREMTLRSIAGKDVIFLGHLDRASALPELYASSDIFLFASETETLGLVVLEAMASGLPVVATPAGGVADHLHDGHNGLAFAVGDVGSLERALTVLAADSSLRARLAHGARRSAERRSWESELDRLDISYREVCGVGAAPSLRATCGARIRER